jgi:hypothetical protein
MGSDIYHPLLIDMLQVVRQEFLVAYDYGMGAAWTFVLADSEAQVRQRLPEVTIVHERPAWMSEEHERRLHEQAIDIEDSSNAFLAALAAGREGQAQGGAEEP